MAERPRRSRTPSRRGKESASSLDLLKQTLRYTTPISQIHRLSPDDDDDDEIPTSVSSGPHRLVLSQPRRLPTLKFRNIGAEPSVDEADLRQKAAAARALLGGHEDELSSSPSDDGGEAVAATREKPKKRQRSGTTIDVDDMEPPPSAQGDGALRKKLRQDEVFDFEKVRFDINVQVFSTLSLRSPELSFKRVGSSNFDPADVLDESRESLELRYEPGLYRIKRPPFGMEMMLLVGSTVSIRENCKDRDSFKSFAETWWDTKQKRKAMISVSARVLYEVIKTSSTQQDSARQTAPSASQRQRQVNTAQADLRAITGEQVKVDLVKR
jgi:hypothetical protein